MAAQSESSLPETCPAKRLPSATVALGARAAIFLVELPIVLPPDVAKGITVFPLKS